MVGDSLANVVGQALQRIAPEQGLDVRNLGAPGCGILPGVSIRYGVAHPQNDGCVGASDLWAAEIASFDPDVVVAYNTFWDEFDWQIGAKKVRFGSRAWDAFATERFSAVMQQLGSGRARVAWLLAPYFRPDVIDAATKAYRKRHGRYDSALDDSRVRHLNRLYQKIAATQGCRVSIVDTRLCVCPDDRFAEKIDGIEIRDDGVHFTTAGADRLARYLLAPIAGGSTACAPSSSTGGSG
jgi:hypothetical protein